MQQEGQELSELPQSVPEPVEPLAQQDIGMQQIEHDDGTQAQSSSGKGDINLVAQGPQKI